jgi:SAM-dependent methyltransferase
MFAAAHICHCSLRHILPPVLKDLFLPSLLAAGFLLYITTVHRGQGWPFLAFISAVCFMLYATAFYFLSAHLVEKNIVRGVVLSLSGTLYSFYRQFRTILERVPLFRSAILYTVEIKNTLLDSSTRDRAAVERLYRDHEDPFGFARDPERFRYQRAMEMLQAVSKGRNFAHALEIGCAEGMFTRKLAECCDTVVAVDLSKIALERARKHCSDLFNVQFAEWDVRGDSVNGVFDLIVATGVLEYILRPSTLRDALERMTAGLRPGGYLLLGNTVTDNGVEHTWIGKKLIRGALINDYFASDARYETVDASLDQCVCPFAHILLRRRLD